MNSLNPNKPSGPNAADLAHQETKESSKGGGVVVLSSLPGLTSSCANACRAGLEKNGYEVRVFDATGSGGRAMESCIAKENVLGVIDITLTELANELVGGSFGAGRDRMTTAAIKGLPQVISLGGLDFVHLVPPESLPKSFLARRLFPWVSTMILCRTTPEENDKLGKEIAEKASAARGPTTVIIPLRGLSALDVANGPFWWPEANAALFRSVRNWMSPNVKLVELDLHINDLAFAEAVADRMLQALGKV